MKRLKLSLSNMRITQKMAIGYIVLILLPIALFGFILYNQFYNQVLDDYAVSKQRLLEQANDNLNVNLAQAASVYQLLQYNAQVVEYLDGRYFAESDQVFTFLKDIRPIFNYAYLGNSSMNSIRLFKFNRGVLPVIPEIPDAAELKSPDGNNKLRLDDLPPAQGMWVATETGKELYPAFTYYQHVYNDNYTKKLAVLEVAVNDQPFLKFAGAIMNEQKESLLVIGDDNRIIYQDEHLPLTSEQLSSFLGKRTGNSSAYYYWKETGEVVNSLYIAPLHIRVVLFSSIDDMFNRLKSKAEVLALLMVLLFLVLSVLYYLLSYILSRRIIRLARHMRKVDEHNLELYQNDAGQDEIGVLTSSFNSMIRRIDELINTVHRVELMKREADYQVLQAQIKPHFLYNTLESIKMLAEINDDTEVVEATYTLAQLLRYSLSSGDNESSLMEEVRNIEHYLKIHRLRMGDRLEYHIDILANIEKVRCPRFILQPLVENCIAHGVSKMRKKGVIDIRIEEYEDTIVINIADNGIGMPLERLVTVRRVLDNRGDRKLLQTSDGGHGLYNVSERVKAFFGPVSRLEIHSSPSEGTVYTLILNAGGGTIV